MMSPKPLVQQISDENAQALWERSQSVEQFLEELRRHGAFQVESIQAVRKFAKVNLGQAKEIVHFSKTWADMRESSEALHEALYQGAIEDGWVERQVEEPVKSVA